MKKYDIYTNDLEGVLVGLMLVALGCVGMFSTNDYDFHSAVFFGVSVIVVMLWISFMGIRIKKRKSK